jgi:PEGA domain
MRSEQRRIWTWVSAWMLTIAVVPVLAQKQEKNEPVTETKEEHRVYEVGSKTRVHLGGVTIGAGYTHYGAPYYYWPYAYPYYWGMAGPYMWPYSDNWSLPYPPGSFAQGYGRGEVKLDSSAKSAEVYIDGAYAGVAQDLKSIWLDPGAYNLELKAEGYQSYTKRIYVLSGKSLTVVARLSPEPVEADK